MKSAVAEQIENKRASLKLCASVQQIGHTDGLVEFMSIATSVCSIGNDDPFVPTCPLAEHRAQRQSRMLPSWRRHRSRTSARGSSSSSARTAFTSIVLDFPFLSVMVCIVAKL